MGRSGIEQEVKDALSELVSDYRILKNRLYIRICNRESNKERLQDMVHRDFLDFTILPCIDMGRVTGMDVSGFIPHGIADLTGIDENRIIEDAITNSTKIRPAVIKPLSVVMEELTGVHPEPSIYEAEDGITVITTDGLAAGAAAVLYPGVLGRVAEEKGADLLLIPSSVNEFLVLKDDGILTREGMEALISEVNSNIVAEEERLSDHLYRFDRRSGEIKRV